MKTKLIMLLAGGFIAFGSWVPLWIVEARDPRSIPFELGLLTFAISFVGAVVALVGLIRLVIHAARTSN